MSNIDKRALREAAEKATPGRIGDRVDGSIKYTCRGTDGTLVLSTDNHDDYGFVGDNSLGDELFFRLCDPVTVLALLDELEAAEKRIAELEAREVKLPNPHAHLIWIQAGHAPDDYWDDVAVSHSEKDKCCDGSDRYPVYALWEIKEALSAIGINIAAAGKGE
ncbi:ead/Ea22-like family protein, partial [Enterobacter hormaechei]